MKWLSDTIAGRTILVLVVGIGSVLVLSHILYEVGLERETKLQNTARLAERLVFLKHALMRLPDDQRDEAAHSMSGGPIEAHWSLKPLATPGGTSLMPSDELRRELLARAPEIGEHGLIIGASQEVPPEHAHQKAGDHDHILLISMQLDDQSWINLSQVVLGGSQLSSPSFWVSVFILGFGTVVVSALMAHWLTRPLSALTRATRELFASVEPTPIPQQGPREVRELSIAFNEMQERIKRLVNDRTQTLAAISHDLRTPLTRLRLRLEGVADESMKASVSADLHDMEEMVEATLAFLKGEGSDEAVQTFDLVAILDTITSDLADAGAHAELSGARYVVMRGRRLALKRAFTNLMQNAVDYGGSVRTKVVTEGGTAKVTIEDDGPGIPEAELERVFSPFYRIESSRDRDTGGHGLGLTVAQTIVGAHGGEITLRNRQPCGLRVTVVLPENMATTDQTNPLAKG